MTRGWLTCDALAELQRALLAWYGVHQRALPWRREQPDPYHVLVSELMLQQTQVATVVDYFERFVAALPTLEALAQASEQQVLRLWQGLGYYRRARHLHAAAQAVMREHEGRIPSDPAALLSLPGVGRYSAGAIASIAYDQNVPILDGNVVRVLSRWACVRQPTDAPATRRKLWNLAGWVVPDSSPGRFNQALMELGALVCVPSSPLCPSCPVRPWCGALRRGLQNRLPLKRLRAAPKPVEHAVLALERRGRYLFEQRPERGLWARLWQFPTLESAVAGAAARSDELEAWARVHLGLTLEKLRGGETFVGQISHRTIRFTLWRATARGRLQARAVAWRRLDELDDLPLARPQLVAVKLLRHGLG